MTFIYDEMQLLKSKTEEATELATQALNSAANTQNNANEAIKISTDANLKLNNLEKRLKALEENHTDFSSQTDKTNTIIQDLETKLTTTNKNISTTSNKVNDISSFIDNISRDNATKTSHNISHDNPDPAGLIITYANIAANNIRRPSKPTSNPKNPPS